MWWIGPAATGVASAAGGAAGAGDTVALLGVLAAAWLAAHLLVERAQQRILALTGVEYVLLGVFLGRSVLPSAGPLLGGDASRPLFAFVVGWIGFLAGLQALPAEAWRDRRATFGGFLDATLRGTLTAAATLALARAAAWTDDVPTLAAAVAVACAAAAPSSAAVGLLASRYPDRPSTLLPFLRRWTSAGPALAILASGGGFAFLHVGETIATVAPGPGEWLVFTVGIGVALAVCFLLFLGRDRSQNHVFLAATGTLLFASGAAFFLHLSALTVNFVLGLLLGHTAVGPGIRDAVDRTAGPARIVLLLFAGTLWRPVDPLLGVALPALVLAVRFAAGSVAGFVGTLGSGVRADLVRGTWAQGDVAVAIAVSLRIAYGGPAVDVAFHGILAAVVVSELTAPRALRGLLVDAGEIDEDVVVAGRAP